MDLKTKPHPSQKARKGGPPSPCQLGSQERVLSRRSSGKAPASPFGEIEWARLRGSPLVAPFAFCLSFCSETPADHRSIFSSSGLRHGHSAAVRLPRFDVECLLTCVRDAYRAAFGVDFEVARNIDRMCRTIRVYSMSRRDCSLFRAVDILAMISSRCFSAARREEQGDGDNGTRSKNHFLFIHTELLHSKLSALCSEDKTNFTQRRLPPQYQFILLVCLVG
jgi:hypothetical protein